MSARSEFTTVDSMPVALNNPNSPMPGSIAAALGAGTATVGPTATAGLSADFLALLARMNVTLAPDAQAKVVAAMASFGDPADPTALPEVGELLETSAPETEKDEDTKASEEDEALAAALGLPALVMAVPVAPALETTASKEGDDVTVADSLGGILSGEKTSPGATLAELTARLLASQSAQLPSQAMATTQKDAPIASAPADDASAAAGSASTSASTSSPTTLTAHLHALSTHSQSGHDPSARELRAPVGTHAWTQQLGDELAWMAQQGRDSASLKLSPEHLGPLEVRISMREGEASVWFGAANAETRSALEQALPRLRELFASQGLALADAGVFREAPRHQNRSPSFDPNASRLDSVTEVAPASGVAAAAARLLDTYA